MFFLLFGVMRAPLSASCPEKTRFAEGFYRVLYEFFSKGFVPIIVYLFVYPIITHLNGEP